MKRLILSVVVGVLFYAVVNLLQGIDYAEKKIDKAQCEEISNSSPAYKRGFKIGLQDMDGLPWHITTGFKIRSYYCMNK